MKLIVNADDYGLTRGVSQAILDGMREGIITDTSALVTAPGFEESAAMALDVGVREMGLHVLLTMGKPALPTEKVLSLVNKEGNFYTRDEFLRRKIDIAEAEAEIEAQIGKLLKTGLKLNHIDSHHGLMNQNASMRDLFIRIGTKYDKPVRNEASRYCKKEVERIYFEKGLRMAEHFYVNHHSVSAHKTEHVLQYLEEALKQYRLVEIACHPGYNDEELEKISVLNKDRETDFAVFMNEEIKKYIRDNGIELVSYTDAFKGESV